MKLALGTVQFGLDYGISNAGGRTAEAEVARILAFARESGIRVLDTAAAYGDAETVLGRVSASGFRIISKVPGLERNPSRVAESLERSLRSLRVPCLDGLLLHRAGDLLENGGDRVWETLAQQKSRGLVGKIGVSVYTPEETDRILSRFPIELIQIPLNVLDQRFIASGALSRLKSRGVEVHARSAFLQGLLLLEPKTLSGHFSSVKDHLRGFRDQLKSRGLTPLQACLAFSTGVPEVDHVIIGVNTLDQLREILAQEPVADFPFPSFAISDPKILNPSEWNK